MEKMKTQFGCWRREQNPFLSEIKVIKVVNVRFALFFCWLYLLPQQRNILANRSSLKYGMHHTGRIDLKKISILRLYFYDYDALGF
jgi:hypothetical protein